jgi:2-amino-4-hydroxy-6-hydroxymethyldihydropteridine diphosphokinase
MTVCYIGIGSNLGDRREYIDRAIRELEGSDGIRVKRVSSIYETDPVGMADQGKFLNGVIEINTDLKAPELLKKLRGIESMLGRVRGIKNGPRTIDLDILYFGDENIVSDDLVVPHPRIKERGFVLKGLRELGKE